jgi:hypothetical protein
MKKEQLDLETRKADDIRLILDGHWNWKMYAEYCRKTHKLGQNRCSQLYQELWEDIKERFKLEKDKLVSKHLDRYWGLYQGAINKEDYNTARLILQDISKLQGLNEPDKMELNGSTVIEFKFGGDEQEQL